MKAKQGRVLFVGAALLAVVVSACTSSAESGGGSTTTAKADASLLGPVNKASGSPVKLGFMYEGSSPTGDNKDQLEVAQAAAKYANERLGGVGGRPVELDVCADHQTPSGATDCANQMITDEVVAVVDYTPANPAQVVDPLVKAKIPLIVFAGGDASVLMTDGVSTIGNPLGFVGAPLKTAKADGLKTIAMIYPDVPAAAQLPVLAKSVYQKQGIETLLSSVPLGTADLTPQVQAAISNGADQFFVIGDDQICATAIKAMKNLAFDGKVYSNTNCLASDAGQDLGGFDNLYYVGASATSDLDAEVRLYHAVLAEYAAGVKEPDSDVVPGSYGVVLAFVRAMKDVGSGDITNETTAATLLAMHPQTLPLLAGQTFQCDRKKSELLPSVCSNATVIEPIASDGTVKKVIAFDATPYL